MVDLDGHEYADFCLGDTGAMAGHSPQPTAWGLAPDIVTLGKAIGGGVPIGAYGLTREVADRIEALPGLDLVDMGGVGGDHGVRSGRPFGGLRRGRRYAGGGPDGGVIPLDPPSVRMLLSNVKLSSERHQYGSP